MQHPKIVCTLGPASLTPAVLRRFAQLGVGLLRINLSHVAASDLPAILDTVRAHCDIPLCIDTEGPQLRTGTFARPLDLQAGTFWEPTAAEAFHPASAMAQLRPGDLLSIGHRSVLAQVCANGGTRLEILQGGRVGSNKAVSTSVALDLPILSERDLAAIEIANARGIHTIALSFAGGAADVAAARSRMAAGARVLAKVESYESLVHLDELLESADGIWIDRGDLSEHIPPWRVAEVQARVSARARERNVPVYVATDVLASMQDHPQPTQAEVNDVFGLLASGVHSLALAAETAVGAYPVACAATLLEMIERFERHGQEPLEAGGGPLHGDGAAATAGGRLAAYPHAPVHALGPAELRWLGSRRCWRRVAGIVTAHAIGELDLAVCERVLETTEADVVLVVPRAARADAPELGEAAERWKRSLATRGLADRVLLAAPIASAQNAVGHALKLGCTDVVLDTRDASGDDTRGKHVARVWILANGQVSLTPPANA